MAQVPFAQQLLEVVPVAVYVFDVSEERVLYLNRGIAHALGYSRDELMRYPGSPIAALLHPDDHPRLARHLGRLRHAGDGESFDFEYRVRAKDGQWRWFRGHDVVLERDRHGAVRRTVGIAADITDDCRLEDERDRLVSIIEAASDYIAMARPDGSGLYINRAGRRMTGVGEDEDCRDFRIDQWHTPEDTRRIFEEAMPKAARGELARLELGLLHRDGHSIPVSMSLSAHRGRDGRVSYFSTIMRDISREKEAAAEIRRLGEQSQRHAREARAAEARAETLRRSISSELREPVEALRRGAERLLAHCSDHLDPGCRDELHRIASSAQKLADLAGALAERT